MSMNKNTKTFYETMKKAMKQYKGENCCYLKDVKIEFRPNLKASDYVSYGIKKWDLVYDCMKQLEKMGIIEVERGEGDPLLWMIA